MKYTEALTALINQQYHQQIVLSALPSQFNQTRDQIAVQRENIRIAGSVFGELVEDEFYGDDSIDFGTFDNCREYGLTVTIGDWTFCAYEHRNGNSICIEGCPTAEVTEWGPYGAGDKFDVLFSTQHRKYEKATEALISGMRAVEATPGLTRLAVKTAMATTTLSWAMLG